MGNRGAILIISLWILAILAVLAAGLGRSTAIELKRSRFQKDRLAAGYMCRSQIMTAIAAIDANPKSFSAPVQTWAPAQSDGLKITDMASRINLRQKGEIARQLLINLFLRAGAEESEAAGLSDTVIDWTDTDTIAGDGKGQAQEPPFFKNGPFCNPCELLAVIEYYYEQNPLQGSDDRARQIYNAIAKYISVYPESGVNLNTASADVLQMFCRAGVKAAGADDLMPGVDGLVEKILQRRQEHGFESDNPEDVITALSDTGLTSEEINILNLLGGLLQVQSDHFEIQSSQSLGDCRRRVTVVYNRLNHKIVDWHEN